MKKDAHFYALLAMARSVGIEKETAHKIAYASQFVDCLLYTSDAADE